LRLLTTPDLILEPQTEVHAVEMFAVLGDPAIYEYENAPPPSGDWLRSRYARLESRRSPDGTEAWLNWVIRVPGDGLAGYIQATVREGNVAAIAYVLCSQYWGRGLASQAVEAMLAELAEFYGVQTVLAVVKQQNQRSLRLLQRFGFSRSEATPGSAFPVQQDEYLMTKRLSELIVN